MHPGFVFINTKIFGYVFVIQLKTCIYKETWKAGTNQRNKQAYGNYPFEHLRKGNWYSKR